MNRIIRCFLNADLRGQHLSLSSLARAHKIRTDQLEPGSFLVFVNKRRTILKLFASNNVIAYYKTNTQRPVDLRVISQIPLVFNGLTINYDKALEKMFNNNYRIGNLQ